MIEYWEAIPAAFNILRSHFLNRPGWYDRIVPAIQSSLKKHGIIQELLPGTSFFFPSGQPREVSIKIECTGAARHAG
jgi:hypothetical protein